jgi:hypothetical protein
LWSARSKLVIKVAKVIGIDVVTMLLAIADEVIEQRESWAAIEV